MQLLDFLNESTVLGQWYYRKAWQLAVVDCHLYKSDLPTQCKSLFKEWFNSQPVVLVMLPILSLSTHESMYDLKL
jgi:hypothetical protein